MDFQKLLDDSFGCPVHVTRHARDRISSRFDLQMVYDLKYLISGALKQCSVDQLSKWPSVAFVDDTKYTGIVLSKDESGIRLVTAITGKASDTYHDCEVFKVRISKEKHLAESDKLQRYLKSNEQRGRYE